MSGIGVLFVIIWLIRYSQTSKGSNSGASTANKPPIRIYYFVWIVWYLLVFELSLLELRALGLFFLFLFPVVLFPSAVAQAFIRFGWVKTSYWLGRIAFFVHRNDPFGGALFYGWQALRNVSPDKREQQKSWLKNRLAQYKTTLGSGAILMHSLFQAEDLDNDAILARFKFLEGCNKNWIPGNLSRMLFRYLLARACEKRDWNKIGELARYWQTISFDPLAKWLNLTHWTARAKKLALGVRLEVQLYYLYSGLPKLKQYLPALAAHELKKETLVKPVSLTQLKIEEFKKLHTQQADNIELNQAWQEYFEQQSHQQWMPRIKALGCFNDEEIYLRLQTSVRDQISLRSGEDDLSSEVAMQERDRNFNLLAIKIRAMTNRTQQKKVMTGIQEYEEFLAIVRIAEQLGKDNYTRSQVFFQMRSPCWNWVVELWNNKKNKPLAFLVCSYMTPFADQFGDTDAYNFFYGITTNRFK